MRAEASEALGETPDTRGAAVLVLHEDGADSVGVLAAGLCAAGFAVELHALSPEALQADRLALSEIDARLAALARRPGVDRERLGVLGFGRGGTLAFLLGCTRSVAAVVDVDGPVLYPALSPARPIQPLELALNLEGAFLGLFRVHGVGVEELELLRARLGAAARPHELVLLPDALPGYDATRAEELLLRVRAFLGEHLAAPRE